MKLYLKKYPLTHGTRLIKKKLIKSLKKSKNLKYTSLILINHSYVCKLSIKSKQVNIS